MIRGFMRLQADVGLAQREMIYGLAAKPLLKRAQLPRGEGRPVLLLPGFGANEALLKRLNEFLIECGYASETFIPGFPKDESLQEFVDDLSLSLSQKVRQLNERTGKAVSMVGQSAGGIYSREFALRFPEGVDRVITLGSPTICPENLHMQNKALNALVERRFGTSAERTFADGRFVHWEKHEPQLPYVAIYSPIDGAVNAETVIIPESQLNVASNGAIRENIAVRSSHFGMVLNPFVMLAVADRLGAEPENWQAFDPDLYLPQVLRRISSVLYPTADTGSYEIPSMDLHPQQPRGRDARERVTRTLKTEHENIDKLLNILLEEIGSSASAASGVPNYASIAGILDYLRSYTDGFHHPREDLLFERLRKRQSNVDQVISTLLEEHQWFDSEGQALTLAMQEHLESKRGDQRSKRLDAQVRRYGKKLLAHLRREETEVFAHAGSLHPHDWAAVDKGLAYEPDPLFGREVQQRFEELADALAGRVEGIGASVALGNVIGLETTANGVDAIRSALGRVREQRAAQKQERQDTRRRVLDEAWDERSLRALLQLPLSLTRANGELARDNARANCATAREVAGDVLRAMRQARETG